MYLVPCLQSAYRKHHSIETALLKVLSDVYAAVDDGEVTLLTLLDLSSAFDTVDHTILCDRLQHSFGIRGRPLDWFRSYLAGRSVCRLQWQDINHPAGHLWSASGFSPGAPALHFVCR